MMHPMFAEKVASRIELPDGYSVSEAKHNGQWQICYKDEENAFKVLFGLNHLHVPKVDAEMVIALDYKDYHHLIEFSQQSLDIAKRFVKEYKLIKEAFDQL